MKIYLAGIKTLPHAVNYADSFLESYLAFRKPPQLINFLKTYPVKDFFLDSGAFSAFTLGEKIDIDEYIDFIKQTKQHLDLYANLDVIGDPEATLKNWEYMKSKGVDPLPVIHYGADDKYFDIYLNKYKVDYLALGGLVPYTRRRRKLKAWLDHSFGFIKEKWPVKIHLFGVTTQWVLQRYPAYSCDSTGWLYGGKRGRILDFKDGKLIKTELSSYFAKVDDYKKNDLKCIHAYLKMEKYMTDLWKERGITWNK